jgi:tRNA threonylcarbamoyladenosine biosynthesis protein TsaE
VRQVLVPTLELTTSGPADTREVAAALAPLLLAGDVVALSGDLGAGKTCFVQGAVRGLGVEGRVTSPTFVLVRQYDGRLPIVHCDVYRLDRLQDVHELGDEVLAPEVVTFLEWADAVRPLLPDDRLEVELHIPDPAADEAALAAGALAAGAPAAGPGAGASAAGIAAAGAAAGHAVAHPGGDDAEVADGDERRTATLRAFGPRWSERADALSDAVRPWLNGAPGASPTDGGSKPEDH